MNNLERKTVHLLWAVLICLILAAGCQTEQQSRTAPYTQQQSDEQSWAFDYHQSVLPNGLTVITLEDFSCPIVTVQLWYHVGSKNEKPDRQGFAHMFEHMMFRGTDKLGPTDHTELIRRTGGTCNAYTGFDRTVYLQTLPANQLELALWLEAERMTFLKIDQESFDTERNVVCEERRVGINEPYGTAVERLVAELFKEHPYRWLPIGKINHLRATTTGELRNFWSRYYVPSNAVLVIVGAVKHDEALRQSQRYFGWIPRYKSPPEVKVKEPYPKAKRSVTIMEDNAPAPVLGLAWRSVSVRHKDAVPLDFLAEILGGGHSSRLYRRLVAEEQLAVAARAYSYSLEQDGVFAAGAVLTPIGGEPNAVMEIIEAEVERLRTKPVSDLELTKAKNQLLKGLVTDSLTVDRKARLIGQAAVDQGDTSRVNRYLDEIRSVTAQDLLRVARTYLTNKRTLEVTIPKNLSREPLESIKAEMDASITAKPETEAPAPGRDGLIRPDGFPADAPTAKITALKPRIKHTSGILPNHLKVIVIPNHEVPFVSFQLGLLSGAWAETMPGSAAMTMQMLTKGTENYTEGQLAEELETYAISLAGDGQMDTCTISGSCLPEHIQRAMRLLGEVVLRPTFPEEEFTKLRRQVLTSLAVSSQEPDYIADKQFRKCLYGEHPYARTVRGEIEDVEALKLNDLKKWWTKFVRPDMAVLIFAGDIEQDEAMSIAEKVFGRWYAETDKPLLQLPKPPADRKTHIYLVDRPGSVQSQIRVGQLGITRHNPGYFVSRIVSSYFGWAFGSRLNETIRVEKGLTYSVWGSYIADRFAGKFEVNTFSKTESTTQTVNAVLEEIERLKKEPPSRKELDDNRSYMLGSYVRHRETPQDIARDLWLIESQNLGDDYLDRFLEGVAKTDKEDCERLIEDTLDTSKLIIVVVGDAAKLESELAETAPVTVIREQSDI
jgi:zinc protease